MENALLFSRLASLATLTEGDEEALAALPLDTLAVSRRQPIVPPGTRPAFAYAIVSGWAARYELRGDGSRRITGFVLPGDVCAAHAICDVAMGHGMVAIIDCEVSRIEGSAIAALARSSPALNQALWRAALVEDSILRKWLLYSTNAYRGVAHLLCELYARAALVGLAANGHCHLPLTQEEIGDAMGITAVHTNRVIRRLRSEGLIDISQQALTIRDAALLSRAAEFNGGYLEPWRPATAGARLL